MQRGWTLKPLDLISSARLLVAGNSKPSQANLRRATSSAYYALFHCLARTGADLLVGGQNAAKSKHTWKQVYRALEHGAAKTACADKLVQQFPKSIEDFANSFVAMQSKRHAADYDPTVKLIKSEVVQDIASAERTIRAFGVEGAKDRRAFCAFVLFKRRM